MPVMSNANALIKILQKGWRMQLAEIGVEKFYQAPIVGGNYRLKEEIEDFIVQEINADSICALTPLVDMERFYASEAAYSSIPETASKECRRPIYDSVRHFPFRKLKTVEGVFAVEETDHDIFLCTLMKYNVNTADAVHVLARQLGISPRHIQIGGNKDKRGVTFQEISIDCSFKALFNYAYSLVRRRRYCGARYGYHEGLDAANDAAVRVLERYMDISPRETDDRLVICNIRKGAAKRLGDNIGNRFKIKISGLAALPHTPHCFLNYYGHQRFGKSLNNHLIGEHILNKEYDQALDLIMASGLPDHSSIPAEVGLQEEGGVPRAGCDDGQQRERFSSLQKYIMKMRRQHAKSKFIVQSMDRMSRMMYMHAYQSYLFNLAVNLRLEKQAPMPGDCIFTDGSPVGCAGGEKLEDVYIPLEKRDDKFLKGGYRKMIESIGDFTYAIEEDGVVVEFSLSRSCYATAALREVIGDSVYWAFE